jgi:hypothetical protein
VPIKDEHKIMLIRALLPLHKAKNLAPYHPQLSYCMALFVAKDHALTRDIIPGLLRYWPFGSSSKQIMFLNELEDLFEYVQEDDVPAFREQLALRLAKCVGGLHFQVAERTLLLWNSERFAALLLEHEAHRRAVLPILFPTLYTNQESHWHETIRTLSAHILEQYGEVDHELFVRCKEEFEARMAAQEAAEAAAAAAGSPAGGSGEAAGRAGASPGEAGRAGDARAAGSPGGLRAGDGAAMGTPLADGVGRTPGALGLGSAGRGLGLGTPTNTGSPGSGTAAAAASHMLHHSAHKAPAVRAASSFPAGSVDEVLPHSTPKRTPHREPHLLPLPLPMSAGDAGGAGEGADE